MLLFLWHLVGLIVGCLVAVLLDRGRYQSRSQSRPVHRASTPRIKRALRLNRRESATGLYQRIESLNSILHVHE